MSALHSLVHIVVGFVSAADQDLRHTLCDRCLPKKNKKKPPEKSEAAQQKIPQIFLTQCEEQCAPRPLGESLFFQIIVLHSINAFYLL